MSTTPTTPSSPRQEHASQPPLATPTRNLFVVTNMSAKISTYTIEKSNNKEYVAYHIECKLRDLYWSVMKRYSECHAFHTRLSSTLVCKEHKINFPPKLFGKARNFNTANIEKRLADLQRWFDAITSANSVWYTNYEALILEFLETEENLSKIIAARCKVEVPVVKEQLSQASTFLGGLPDWNQAIEAILHEKTNEVVIQSGEDYQKARKALCEQGHSIVNAVDYLKNIRKVMDATGHDRSGAVSLYYKSGSNVQRALELYSKEANNSKSPSATTETTESPTQ